MSSKGGSDATYDDMPEGANLAVILAYWCQEILKIDIWHQVWNLSVLDFNSKTTIDKVKNK